MSVTVRPYRRGGWQVDVRLALADGKTYRQRKRITSSKSAARRWGEDRERHVLVHGPPTPEREVPTLAAFKGRFLEGHAHANRQKPSGIASKERILRVHLIPTLGNRKLDAITNEDVARLKVRLRTKAPKTVNNILTVLSVLLKKAAEWNVIDQMPCTVPLLKVSHGARPFYTFDEYDRFVTAASAYDSRAHVLALLSGRAGLRLGEMIALQWSDVDWTQRQICVQRSAWKGQVGTPKGGRLRYVPLTSPLAAALRAVRHMRGPLVLYQDDGQPMTERVVQRFLREVGRRAGLVNNGPHMLRHTFCSHLAMQGAPAGAIQQLAGHRRLSTTEQYMHMSPAAVEAAIQLLEPRSSAAIRGNRLATEFGAAPKALDSNS